MKTSSRFLFSLMALALTATHSDAARMPKLDSSAFDFKYEMETLPTAEDLDDDGTPDFSLSVNGRSTLETGVGCGLIDCMSDGCCYIQSANGAGAWAQYGASAATGFTVEARIALRNHGSGQYAMSLAASVPDSDIRALLHFSVVNGTTLRAWWGDTSLTNMVHDKEFHTWRIARAANAATYSVWCDGALVARDLGGANADDWGLLLGSASRNWKSAAYVSYLRFTKGGYAPMIEERGSEAFAHKYDMDANDSRLSATATTADWALTVGSGVSASLGGRGVLSAYVPQGKLCYWQSGPMDSSVTEASPFTLETRFRVHDSWEAEGKVFSIFCGTPREYAYLIVGTNSVRWVDGTKWVDGKRPEYVIDTNDNSDAMHVFRIAFSGDGDTAVSGFTLWRDGERVPAFIKPNIMGSDENCVIFGVGASAYGGSFEVDYVRWTTDGVFAPVTPPMATMISIR